MALKKNMTSTKARTAMTFRFLNDVRSALMALSTYSGLSYTEVIENLVRAEYERLEKRDPRGLKTAEKDSSN